MTGLGRGYGGVKRHDGLLVLSWFIFLNKNKKYFNFIFFYHI